MAKATTFVFFPEFVKLICLVLIFDKTYGTGMVITKLLTVILTVGVSYQEDHRYIFGCF